MTSTDETWSWEDGTPIQFVNWSPNEPNGDSSSQACVEAFHQTNPGEWNDHSCAEAQYYICKMPIGKLKTKQRCQEISRWSPEVNLRYQLHAGDERRERGITLGWKPRVDFTRSPKQGYQWRHKNDLCPPKIQKRQIATLKWETVPRKIRTSWI